MPQPSSNDRRTPTLFSLADAAAPDMVPAAKFPIVAIGASAGGLAALSRLLEGIPRDSGIAFVIITHLDPSHESHMPELLGRHTAMPVVQALEGQAVQVDHVYVIPPNATLTIDNGILHLGALPERPFRTKPIDMFMRDLARDQKSSSIAIVLTGIDADGSIGLKQIKAEGGMVMVQEPHTAEYTDMPRHAVATGLADLVLPVEQMGPALVDYVRNAGLRNQSAQRTSQGEQDEMAHILVALMKGGAPDFRDYKPGMIMRRIKNRMGIMGVADLADFRAQIESSADARKALAGDFLVGVTEFFREPDCWDIVNESLLPELFARKGDAPLRVWVPACASGEEAYTLAMLLQERAPTAEARAQIEIFATDIDRAALEVARAGIYTASVAHALTPERIRRYFVQNGDFFQVKKELRSMILFSPHNLLADPPFSRMDIVSCRNLLIYLKAPTQRNLAALFAFALNDEGYLLLGRAENVVDEQRLFEEVFAPARIYRRKPGTRPRGLTFPLTTRAGGHGRTHVPTPPMRVQETAQLVHKTLLARFAPAAVLTDRSFRVLFFHGQVEPFLRRAAGVPTDNLLEMARDGLALKIRSALNQAVESNRTASVDADIAHESQHVAIRISVSPLPEPSGSGSLYLTTFETLARSPILERNAADAESESGSEAERELRQVRQDMQEVIHDLQQANEELKVANEESLSANEELQSSNEELASSKEEMQSLNEELSSVNAQLEVKIRELEAVNDDLHNFLHKTRIACLFLDRELRVKRYTESLAGLFSILASDVGRPITDFATPFAENDLADATRRVLADLRCVETEVHTADGKWYWRSIQPYETTESYIEGVVVTFTDITGLKKAEQDVRRLATIMQDSNDAITVHDFQGRILAWNRGAERLYGYSLAEAQAISILALVPETQRIAYNSMLARTRKGGTLPSFETQRLTKDGRTLDVWLTVSLLHDEHARPYAVATTERDISDRLRTEHQMRYRTMQLEQADLRRTQFLAMLAHELRNPLAPVRNALHLIRQPGLTPDRLHWATELMDRQTAHLARLIDDLLDVSRITSGKVRLRRERIDMRATIENAVEATDSTRQAREHRLALRLPDEPIWVFGDSARLQQVVGNLLVNAYKYTSPRGEILVEATHDNREVTLRIIDNGVGISPDLLPQVFELFVQGDQDLDRSQGGLGIGLTLVRQLIDMHSGRVEARSKGIGNGSEFVVSLPLVPLDSEPPRAAPPPQAKGVALQRRVLVVDDNVDFADSMKMLLESERHEVRVAYDGHAALDAAREFAPDIILLDLGLPGMNGYEAAQQLRTIPELRNVVLIAVSGYAREEDRQQSAAEGFDGHLAKPVNAQEVLDLVKSR